MTSKIFLGKVFLLVTGASQGIGRKIAEVFGSALENDSRVLLLARNFENLKEVADGLPKHVTTNFESVDLSKATANNLKDIILKSLGDDDINQFNEVVIIHNVGSLGNISHTTVDMTNFDLWRDYFDLNVFAPAVLNGICMEIFKEESIKKHVINITSLFGIQPFEWFGYYCSGKAAREMYFKVFAREHSDVNVLNYSPGPVETEMLQSVLKTFDERQGNNPLKTNETNKILTTDETVKRLVEVLTKKNYKSGDHVDYYDKL